MIEIRPFDHRSPERKLLARQPVKLRELAMHDVYFWITLFGPPLFIIALTVFVFRPSARQHYDEAKQTIFIDDESVQRVRESRPDRDNAPL